MSDKRTARTASKLVEMFGKRFALTTAKRWAKLGWVRPELVEAVSNA